jgi:hypothetical protein
MSELQAIKDYWFAPIEKDFEYHERRDHLNDIAYLVSEVERLSKEDVDK